MTRMRLLFAGLIAALTFAAVPSAFANCANPNNGGTIAAPCVHFVGAGSSAMFQQSGVEAVDNVATALIAKNGGNIHHFTAKGACGAVKCAGLADGRNPNIAIESATWWLVFVCAGNAGCTGANVTDIWEYAQVDSIVGVRMFLAQPSAVLNIAPAQLPQNLINSALLSAGDAGSGGNCQAAAVTCDYAVGGANAALPADVQALASGQSVTTGLTDITAEDAYYGTQRILTNPADAAAGLWTALGYCCEASSTLVGNPILSAFSAASANPVQFSLPGHPDPFNTNMIVPSTIRTFPIGEEAIVFITNRTNKSGLGTVTGTPAVVPTYGNVVDNATTPGVASPIGTLFDGVTCDNTSPGFGVGGAATFAVYPILREPLSGTMNTTEFTEFRSYGGSLIHNGQTSVGGATNTYADSQESFVAPPAGGGPTNPLGGANVGTPCSSGAGKRYRAIGTGEEVGGTAGVGGVKQVADSIGYTFFSFGNVSTIGNNANWGYSTIDGVDGIFASYAGGDPGQPATTAGTVQGTIPVCSVLKNGGPGGCARKDVWTGGNYFPHIVDGTYRSWSILRALCDTANPTCPPFDPTTSFGDSYGTVGLIEAAQDDIHLSSAHSVADFIPLSLDGSFPAGAGSIWGDANFARSHYAFISVAAGFPSDTPITHRTPGAGVAGFHIGPSAAPAAAVPAIVENADQPNGTFSVPISALPGFFLAGAYGAASGVYFTMEQGGDAGGCIINATQSGDLLEVTKVLPVGNPVNHVKFYFSGAGGVGNGVTGPNLPTEPNGAASTYGLDEPGNGGPWGWCGGGPRSGLVCNQSNTGGAAPAFPACGSVGAPPNNFGFTCNPTHLVPVTGDGESIAVSGITGAAPQTEWNGNFRISKFVAPGQIKANVVNAPVVYTAGPAFNPAGAQASISAGCVQ